MIVLQCKMCKRAINIPCTSEQYLRALRRDGLIQDIMPDVPAPLREMFISGTCPQCWDELFKNLDEEE